ncbi:MAG: hypothetical protein K2Y21_08825 [Phycisphaerales bacterium]|nr:hypothetical protein [Phycisphaerales bacterium]
MTRSGDIFDLRQRLAAGAVAREAPSLQWGTGVPLRFGATHEWYDGASPVRGWNPPLCVLAAIATSAVRGCLSDRVVWIGSDLFPYPSFLDHRVLAASVFLDPPTADARVWATDLALSSRSPTCVIADGRGLSLAATRRLQLAAARGAGIGLLARGGGESRGVSAATTRWRVVPVWTDGPDHVAWSVTLLRNKDQPTLAMEERSWVVELGDAQSLVVVPSVVANRADRAASEVAAS